MPRPKKRRRIRQVPEVFYFKPQGIPMRELEELALTLDEIEALRLVDLEGLSQEEAAGHMEVSRQTVGRILNRAHSILAEALITGKAIRVEGADLSQEKNWIIRCPRCHRNYLLEEEPKEPRCTTCKSNEVEVYTPPGFEHGRKRSRRRFRRGKKQ